MKIVIQTKTGSAGKAKEWPYFAEFIELYPDIEFIEVLIDGQTVTKGATPFIGTRSEIIKLLKESDYFISIDSWLQHLAAMQTKVKGLVIFSRSNPAIFGYSKFVNVFESHTYFKANPYEAWNPTDLQLEAFPSIEKVQNAFAKLLDNK